MTLRNLVVGTDGSAPAQSALQWAASLPTTPQITAVAAVDPVSELIADALQLDSAAMVHHVRDELDGPWTSAARDAGIDIETRVSHDDPANALLDVANAIDADTIVVGTHTRRRWSRNTVGSVITKLTHRSDRPVVVVPPEGIGKTGDILVGSDGSTAGDAALEWAVATATATGHQVHLVRVLDLSAYGTELAFARLEVELLRSGVTGQLDDLAARFDDGSISRVEVIDGSPADVLVGLAEDASMLVVGRSRTATDMITGSVARACIARSSAPVVLVAEA